MKLNGKKINFLGDSITEGCGTSGKGHFFSDLIAADTGALCRNYGIGGTRIARQQKPSADLFLFSPKNDWIIRCLSLALPASRNKIKEFGWNYV